MLGFASVLLGKTLRSSTLKLAFIYVIVFSSAIFAVLGYVYWATVTFVSENLDRSISAEGALLIKAYDSAGHTGLTTLLEAASGLFRPSATPTTKRLPRPWLRWITDEGGKRAPS